MARRNAGTLTKCTFLCKWSPATIKITISWKASRYPTYNPKVAFHQRCDTDELWRAVAVRVRTS